MNGPRQEPRIDTDAHESDSTLICKEESFRIVGAAMEVLNVLGPGLLEKPYENALVEELRLRGIPAQQQLVFDVLYKETRVGTYVPDLIAFDQIVIETKVIEIISDLERAQILNYLRITRKRVGLIFNFRRARLEWERMVL